MTAPTTLDCNGKHLDLRQARVMGILNVTPDSFSDGGKFVGRDAALRQAERMVADGAAIIDVGGESTRPGAEAVGVEEELGRVIPVIEAIADELAVPISVDTSKAAVMTAAVAAGAGMINDVAALRGEGALEAAATCNVPVCLMHMQGEPRTMQKSPHYDDAVNDVHTFLAERKAACMAAGIPAEWVVVDPGFGFGKTLEHNLQLMKAVERFDDLGPVLVGVSRKSMIGAILDDAPVDQRLNGSVALAAYSVGKGAKILRVHDVKESAEAVRVINAVMAVQE